MNSEKCVTVKLKHTLILSPLSCCGATNDDSMLAGSESCKAAPTPLHIHPNTTYCCARKCPLIALVKRQCLGILSLCGRNSYCKPTWNYTSNYSSAHAETAV